MGLPEAHSLLGDAPSLRLVLVLVLEVDGSSHEARARRDVHRDAALGRAGYRVLRLSAVSLTHDLEAAVALVRAPH